MKKPLSYKYGENKNYRSIILTTATVLLASLAATNYAKAEENSLPDQSANPLTTVETQEATSSEQASSTSEENTSATAKTDPQTEAPTSSSSSISTENSTEASTDSSSSQTNDQQVNQQASTYSNTSENKENSATSLKQEETSSSSAKDTSTKTAAKTSALTAQSEQTSKDGFQTIDGQRFYFANGYLVKNRLVTVDGDVYYINDQGQPVSNQFVEKSGSFYYLNQEGKALTGWQLIDNKQLYFAPKGSARVGAQYKGNLYTIDGDKYYFDQDSGELWTNRFVHYINNWYYLDETGKVVTGYQTINHTQYYFDNNGKQLKGIGYDNYGQLILTDRNSGQVLKERLQTNRFYQNDNHWYYLNSQQELVKGWQTINGQRLYFNEDGSQVKGALIAINGKKYYFDPNSGELWTNRFVSQKQYSERYGVSYDVWYYLGDDGAAVTGWQTIDGKKLYFYSSGSQAKGKLVWIDGDFYYFDSDSGAMVTNRFVQITPTNNYYYQPVYNGWIYLGNDGAALTGWQTIDGKKLYFQPTDKSSLGYSHQKAGQIKGELIEIDGSLYYFDAHSGELWTNRSLTYGGKTYQIDADGKASLQ